MRRDIQTGTMKTTKILLLLAFALAAAFTNASFGDRQKQMRNKVQLSNSVHAPIVESFRGLPLNERRVNQTLLNLDQDRDAAFDIVILIRILGFGNFAIDSPAKQNIVDTLAPIPFWLEADEETRVYWTENQMIMWMSSEWLLKEQYPNLKQYSATLRDRLVHYLRMKLDWGFVEFFSSVYFPFTLSGLLNLVDFCNDVEIQSLAVQVSQKLLGLVLLVSNDQGEMMAASARNKVGYYTGDPAIRHVVWMLRGVGEPPSYVQHATSFLSTSKLPVYSNVIKPYVDTGYQGSIYAGPSLYESRLYNANLTRVDRTIFQWSMGAYFAPDASADTQYLLDTLNLGELYLLYFVYSSPVLYFLWHQRPSQQ